MNSSHAYLKCIAVLFLLALVACTSGTRSPMSQTTANTPQPEGSTLLSPRENSWNHSAQPVPAPSRTPKYRLNEVTFLEGSTSFGREGSGVCRDAAAVLASRGADRVLLVGYTHRGEAETLGLERARKVRDCLVGHGLSPDVFEMSSFGSLFSRAESTEPVMMEQERRVEIWVISES